MGGCEVRPLVRRDVHYDAKYGYHSLDGICLTKRLRLLNEL